MTSVAPKSAAEIAWALEGFLARQTGAASVRVQNIRHLTGGASRETWSFDAVFSPPGRLGSHEGAERSGEVETLPLILQRDIRGQPKEMSRTAEFQLMRTAHEAGAMAPEPLWFGDGSLGGEFYIVRRIEGENVPRRLLRDEQYAAARAALTRQLGVVLARIHAIPIDGLEGVPRPAATPSIAEQQLERHEQLLRTIAPEPHPAFELAIRWLRTRLPTPRPPDGEARTLVHGDFRIGNVLFGAEGLRAVLDWEIAHVGDPMEDLSWVCVRSWRFGGDKPVGGVGTREEFFAAYEEAGGVKVDPERVRWWEIFGNLRWGIICISQAKVYLDGISKSLELAAIGRRTAETEWELLELMD